MTILVRLAWIAFSNFVLLVGDVAASPGLLAGIVSVHRGHDPLGTSVNS